MPLTPEEREIVREEANVIAHDIEVAVEGSQD